MNAWIYVIIGGLVIGLGLVLWRMFFGGHAPATSIGEPTKKEKDAVVAQTEALAKKAEIVATSEAKKQELQKIMDIEDPKERLAKLAASLKDL